MGTHDFRPECLRAELDHHLDEHGDVDRGALAHALVALLHDIDHGACPRCQGPLRTADDRDPVGSRVRACHCIAICADCGDRETKEMQVGVRYPVFDWYRDREVRADLLRDLTNEPFDLTTFDRDDIAAWADPHGVHLID